LAVLAGVAVGVLLHIWWIKRVAIAKRRIPRQWPLTVRSLVNSKERRVWRWLVRAFLDHHVMVKMPVTRFTMPTQKDQGQHWFQLLSGVYCTFTVCTAEGVVIGCVDVPGPLGLSLSNQTLKHNLLAQSQIGYWVVDPDHMPSVSEIRSGFIVDKETRNADRERERYESQFNASRANLQATVTRRRIHKPVSSNSGGAGFGHDFSSDPDSFDHSNSAWEHDSFSAPLDSRIARLR
jgi:hypothetical protein